MRTLRPFVVSAFALAGIVLVSAKQMTQTNYLLYVGAYGKGVSAFRFHTSDGSLQSIGLTGEVNNPSFIVSDAEYRTLYAVSEVDGNAHGAVAAFSIDRKTGGLKALNTRDSGGIAPCHLAVDHTGKMLVVANYTSGGVSSFPIEQDGSLGEMKSLQTAQGHGPNAERQEGPHAHEVVISSDNKLLYVPDLGLDHIRLYRLQPADASLTVNDPPFVQQDAGFGPRHMVFSHDESVAYVMNELKSEVSVFQHNRDNGSMQKIQDVSSLPAGYTGENGPAEILIDGAGKFVYATNRGNDSIAVFSVEKSSGKLQQVQVISAEGKMPRGLVLDPTGRYLLAGNQKTNNFVVYRVDSGSGKLTPTGQVINTPSPVAFLFVPASE